MIIVCCYDVEILLFKTKCCKYSTIILLVKSANSTFMYQLINFSNAELYNFNVRKEYRRFCNFNSYFSGQNWTSFASFSKWYFITPYSIFFRMNFHFKLNERGICSNSFIAFSWNGIAKQFFQLIFQPKKASQLRSLLWYFENSVA